MSDAITNSSLLQYSDAEGSASWEGRLIPDKSRFATYLRKAISSRQTDSTPTFKSNLQGLATADSEKEYVGRLLNAFPRLRDWEIGEALAECLLLDDPDREIHFPGRNLQDRRSPQASLPGADLVGFYREGDAVLLLFGEVKTSHEGRTPPSVMTGNRGMVGQLERLATRDDIHVTLLKWLWVRCVTDPLKQLYGKASSRLVESKGRDLLLVGMLMRDTAPNELDLKAPGTALATRVSVRTRIQLAAWYLPIRISEWRDILEGAEP